MDTTTATTTTDAIARAEAQELKYRAGALGFKLKQDHATGWWWLSWRHLAQPCETLAAVAAALEPGSGWWATIEKVQP